MAGNRASEAPPRLTRVFTSNLAYKNRLLVKAQKEGNQSAVLNYNAAEGREGAGGSDLRNRARTVRKVPIRVLDAPQLLDNYYLNLLDWSAFNVVAVALGSKVYLYNTASGQTSCLCEVGEGDLVSSIKFANDGNRLAVGTFGGHLQIFDTVYEKRLVSLNGHTDRVGVSTWSPANLAGGEILCSGSRDRTILKRDLRQRSDIFEVLRGHKDEVCGLAWSPDGCRLASGANDNKVLLWSAKPFAKPVQELAKHSAAVKALAWSPHKHGLLASGGGTSDRSIRFWNTLSGEQTGVLCAGSQVCALAYSKHSNQLVSSHGFSDNCAYVWNCSDMSKAAELVGHSARVLYLAMSPDGTQVVTGSKDETLRFWTVFAKRAVASSGSALAPSAADLR